MRFATASGQADDRTLSKVEVSNELSHPWSTNMNHHTASSPAVAQLGHCHAARSGQAGRTLDRFAKRNRLALAVSMMLLALAPELTQAGPGKVCLDGVTPLPACSVGTIGTYYANSPKLRKFVDTLAGLTSAGTNTFASGLPGEYISIAEPDTASFPGSEYFVIGVVEHDQRMHSDLQKSTTQRSYVQLYAPLSERAAVFGTGAVPQVQPSAYAALGAPNPGAPVALKYPNGNPIYWPGTSEQVYGYDRAHYLGPIIITMKGTPVRVKFVNFLPNGAATTTTTVNNGVTTKNVIARNGDMFLPTDVSLAGAGLSEDSTHMYPQNRVAFHLHGGDSPWISDGTPHQWIAASGENSLHQHGDRFMNTPDMPYPGDGAQTTFWPNDQSNRLMWYHDHTFGLTRQNAYAGAAAGYVIIDQAELALLTGTPLNGVPIKKAIPGNLLDQIVLVVQDKTFVPNDIAVQDAKWDQNAWGKPGDLWYPHVYEPFQVWDKGNLGVTTPGQLFSPSMAPAFANPAGRWDYAVDDATGGYRVPNAPLRNDPDYGQVAFPDGSYTGGPSATPESYMDTAVVNGIAYPVLNVDPKAYRVRFLNGANDRYWNLSLWVADSTQTSSDNRSNTEVKLVPADGTAVYTLANGTTVAPADMRPGGVPDPAAAGPNIIRFANEGGLLQQPVVHTPKPMTGYTSAGVFILARDAGDDFYLGGAERADTVIDFSQHAGKTLILYNDSSAPVPGGDDRYDYYFGDPDQSAIGGAPATLAGFGPNTRTVMQIRVAARAAGASAPPSQANAYEWDPATQRPLPGGLLSTELKKAYDASADAHILASGTLPTAFDAATSSMTLNGMPVPLKVKTIRGLTDPNFGRLIAQIGVELPNGDPLGTPLAYIDTPNDIISDGETQYWWLKNNDVDNHPMHFHLFNVQVVARIDQATAAILPPQPDETGWKETLKNWPLEDVIVAVKPKTPALPFGLPRSVRNLDPTLPAGAPSSTYNRPGVDLVSAFLQNDLVTGLPVTSPVVNTAYDFDWEYVWHCHILGHEENDLMRPLVFHPAPPTVPSTPPGNLAVDATGLLSWSDPTPPDSLDANHQLLPGASNGVPTKGNTDNEMGFRVERATVSTDATATHTSGAPWVGSFAALAPTARVVDGRVNTLANATSFQDAPAKFTDYAYQVVAVNEGGAAVSNSVILAQAPATPGSISVTPAGLLQWRDSSTNETGFRIERATVSTASGTSVVGSFAALGTVTANATTFTDVPLANTDYQYRVLAFNAMANPSDSSPSAMASISTLPAAPAIQSVDAASGLLTWIDHATNEDSYTVERATVTTSSTGVHTVNAFAQIGGTLAANTQTLAGFALAPNTDYQYRVSAKNAAGSSVSPIFTYSATIPAGVGSVSVSSAGVLTWLFSASNGVTHYQVNRATVAHGVVGALATLATVANTLDTYTDTTVAAHTDYMYQVVTLAGTGTSVANPVALLAQAPLAASGLTASAVTATSLSLAWLDGSTNEDGFSVEMAVNGGAYAALTNTPVALNTTSYAVTGLTPGSYYTFRVGATKNLAGYTPSYTTTPLIYTPASLVAPVVSVLSSLVSGLPQALVGWTSSSIGQTAFTVERCAGTTAACNATTANWIMLANLPGTGAALSYLDTTLAAGATYVYRVKTLATNTSVVPPVTASVFGLSAQTATAVSVTAPGKLSATSPTGVGVTLAWTDSSTNETSFQVFRTPALAAPVSLTRTTALRAATGGTVIYNDATAVAGTTYAYYVIAVNTTGSTVSASPPSNTANITLDPPVPSGLSALQSGANMVLTWTDTAATETAFEVLRTDVSGLSAAATFSVARTSAQARSVNTAVTYSDLAAIPGTVYSYAVRAVNLPVVVAPAVAVPNYSAYSAAVTTSVLLPAPTNLTTALPPALASGAAGVGVILNWVDNATFESGYRIDRAIVTPDPLGNVPAGTVFTTLLTQPQTGNLVRSTGATAYTDLSATALSAPQVYAYQVYAVKTTAATTTVAGVTQVSNVTSYSAPSNAAHTAAAPVASGAPSGLTAVTSSGTSIVLSWIDNSATETSFLVTRTDALGQVTTFSTPTRSAALQTAVGARVSYTDASAAIGTTYSYVVAAVTSPAGVAPVVTGPSSLPVTASLTLTAPSNASAAQTATGITIGWTDNTGNEIGFHILRTGVDALGVAVAPATFNVTSTSAQRTATGTTRSYIDTTAVPGISYTYTLATTGGTSAAPVYSTAVSTTPVSITETIAAPSTPYAAITSSTRITLTWTDLSTNETGFLVERLLTPTAPVAGAALPVWTTLATVARTGGASTGINTAVSYIDNLVAPPVQGSYQYRVSAVSMTAAMLNAASPAVASNLLDFSLPAAPTVLTVIPGAVGSAAITLGWTDNANNESGYTIQRATNATFTKGLVSTPVPGAIANGPASYVLSGMTQGTKYFFRVAASNAAGTSAYLASTRAVAVP
jgi:FtsP/CotA-like multicopper oxidase with cupredoxin domain